MPGMVTQGLGTQAGSILNSLQGSSGSGFSDSWGTSADYGYNYGIGNTAYDAFGESWGQNVSQAYNRVYGTEASARDFLNAKDANQEARDMWALQAHFNAEEAAKQRTYESEMSNTAYKRAVQDLLSAGLNPILAVGGGMQATTPMGMSASAGLASAHKANTYADSIGWSNASGSSYGYNSATGRGSSYQEGGSYGSSNWGSHSEQETTNNIKQMAEGLGKLTQGAIDFMEQAAVNNFQWDGNVMNMYPNAGSSGKQAVSSRRTKSNNSAKSIGSIAKSATTKNKKK